MKKMRKKMLQTSIDVFSPFRPNRGTIVETVLVTIADVESTVLVIRTGQCSSI